MFPGLVKVLPNYCFRVSHPAVFGVSVMKGRIKPSYLLMKKNGDVVGRIREIQDNAISMQEARKGANVAISMYDVTFGRQVKDNDDLYVFINDENARALRYRYSNLLDDEEKDLLDETSGIIPQR